VDVQSRRRGFMLGGGVLSKANTAGACWNLGQPAGPHQRSFSAQRKRLSQ
jgi:hypothetical protein